jgi:hypothetical protein
MVNMKIKRSIYKQLAEDLHRPEVSIILGPRQVGKTFLLKELESDTKARGLRTRYYNLELPHDLRAFNKDDRDLFRMLPGGESCFLCLSPDLRAPRLCDLEVTSRENRNFWPVREYVVWDASR